MSRIRLSVGKIYRNRLGEGVEITEKCVLTTHAYFGSDGNYYRYNGQMKFFTESDLDLVEETDQRINMRRDPSWDKLFSYALGIDKKAA